MSHLGKPKATPLTRRSFTALLGIGIGALAAPGLAGCGSEPASTSGTATSAATGRYRIVQPSLNPLVVWAVTYLAEDNGYYKAEGLEVSRVLLAGGPAAQDGLLSGAGDILISTPGETLAATAKQQDLKILMGHTNNMPSTFVLSKSTASQIGIGASSLLAERQACLAKIRDGRYGITAPGSQTDGFTRLALKQAGVDPDKDAQLIPLQTAANQIAALSNDRIDGFLAVPPSGETAATEFGAVPILRSQSGEIAGAATVQGMSTVARGQDLQANPGLHAAAIRAEVKAMKQLNEDTKSAGEILRKTRFSSLSDEVWQATWSEMGPSLESPIVTATSLGGWIENGMAGGIAPSAAASFPFGTLIDLSDLDTVLRAANWKPA
jgi:NitT/TauT family transport system substrate-binding protein